MYDVTIPSKIESIVVGDFVDINLSTSSITALHKRKNILSRSYFGKTKELAANLDHLFIVTAGGALLSEDFIDRTLASCHYEGISCSIIFNKIDILSENHDLSPCYEQLGINVLRTSTKVPGGLESLHKFLAEKFPAAAGHDPDQAPILAFCGVSGVGKSSLINTFVPGARQRVGDVSHTGQGQQTTTMALAHVATLAHDRRLIIIDLPGLQKFGITHIPSQALAHCFPDIAAWSPSCRFIDCTHTKEPECAVRNAAEQGTLFASRYKSYLRMRDETLQHEQLRK